MFLLGIYVGGLIVMLLHTVISAIDRFELHGIDFKQITVDFVGAAIWPISLPIFSGKFIYDRIRS